MRRNSCCFTGHRSIPTDQYQRIFDLTEIVVENFINKGYRYFCTGGALGFDTLSALVILKLKERYSFIQLILVLPCLNQTKLWKEKDLLTYEYIKQKADKIIYTSEMYTYGCMHKRNRHLVNNSSLCICYLKENTGGTFYTVNYAKKQNLSIVNIENCSIT